MAEKIIIASGKGGAGKTSLTAGLALSLCAKGQRVLVMDFDVGQGCVDFMLGEKEPPLYHWGDVLKEHCRPEDAPKTAGGAAYLSAPKQWDDAFTPEAVRSLLEQIEPNYDYVLFDSPAGIGKGFLLAAACADRALIVSTPDEICTKAASRAADELFAAGLTDLRLVINRLDKKSTVRGKYLNIDETIDAVRAQLIGVVPEDPQIAYASSSGFASLKDCPGKAAYGRIADRVRGEYVPLVLSGSKKERPRSKKPLIAALCVLAALLIAACGIIGTDYHRCKTLRPPVFAGVVKLEDGSRTHYHGFLFYNIIIERKNGKIIHTEMEIAGKPVLSEGARSHGA